MQGRRLPDVVLGEHGDGWDQWTEALHDPQAHAGIYMKTTRTAEDGSVVTRLYVCDPFGHFGSLSPQEPPDENGSVWTVEEHEDGTITVNPSIWDQTTYSAEDHHPGAGYHGHLQRGVWNP